MARLSEGGPAGCLAEGDHGRWPDRRGGSAAGGTGSAGSSPNSQVTAATSELRGLFELFEDDDVLDLFEMREPGDAAVASDDPARRPFGIADQRIEAWFTPFGTTIPPAIIAA